MLLQNRSLRHTASFPAPQPRTIGSMRGGSEKSRCSARYVLSCCSLPASKDVDSVTSGKRVPADRNKLGAVLKPKEASETCHQPTGRSVLLKETVASYLPIQGGQEQMLHWKQ